MIDRRALLAAIAFVPAMGQRLFARDEIHDSLRGSEWVDRKGLISADDSSLPIVDFEVVNLRTGENVTHLNFKCVHQTEGWGVIYGEGIKSEAFRDGRRPWTCELPGPFRVRWRASALEWRRQIRGIS